MVIATGMARPITMASITSTVAHSLLIPAPPPPRRRPPRRRPPRSRPPRIASAYSASLWSGSRRSGSTAVRGEQGPCVPGGDDRPGDQHPGPGQSLVAGRVVGQAHGHLQGIVEPPGDVHPLRAEHRGGHLGQLVRVHGAVGGVAGHHQLGDHRLHLIEDPGHVLVGADGQHPDEGREREGFGDGLHGGFHAGRVVRGVEDDHRAAPDHLEPPWGGDLRRTPRAPGPAPAPRRTTRRRPGWRYAGPDRRWCSSSPSASSGAPRPPRPPRPRPPSRCRAPPRPMPARAGVSRWRRPRPRPARRPRCWPGRPRTAAARCRCSRRGARAGPAAGRRRRDPG